MLAAEPACRTVARCGQCHQHGVGVARAAGHPPTHLCHRAFDRAVDTVDLHGSRLADLHRRHLRTVERGLGFVGVRPDDGNDLSARLGADDVVDVDRATQVTVPLIGLVRVAAPSDCSTSVRLASAVSIAAWSDAYCCGVSALADEPPPVGEPRRVARAGARVGRPARPGAASAGVARERTCQNCVAACSISSSPRRCSEEVSGSPCLTAPPPGPGRSAASLLGDMRSGPWRRPARRPRPSRGRTRTSPGGRGGGVGAGAVRLGLHEVSGLFQWSFESAASSLVSVV